MLKIGTTGSSFVVATLLAGGVAIVAGSLNDRLAAQGTAVAVATGDAAKSAAGGSNSGKANWAASAPGRVEPRDGEIRIVAQIPGKISHVVVAVNDKVRAGDLLFRLEDEEHEARVLAADAEVAVRTRERDLENVGRLAKDRRAADDAVAKAERTLFNARLDLDAAVLAVRNGSGTQADADKAREAVNTAVQTLEKERANARKVAATKDMPLPVRLESSLAVSRAELSIAETALARTRIRAPIDATVLQVNAKVGEMAAPQSELPMVVLGDLSKLRVRAEFDERDIEKVRVGQAAVVTSDAFPGRNFEAKVTQVARSLAPPKVGQKGPRRPNDVDVLEVFVELNGTTPLLPGMRADVFLKADATTTAPAEATKAN